MKRSLARIPRLVVLAPIRLYRRLLSPLLGARCRYYPSCSAYAEEAVRELGAVRGSIVAAWRLLRCNPFSDGGLDPLAERRLFPPARPDGVGGPHGPHGAEGSDRQAERSREVAA